MERIKFPYNKEQKAWMPEPPIEAGTVVILVQEGKAKIGRLEPFIPRKDGTVTYDYPVFDHSVNSEKLKDAALASVLEHFPDVDLFGPALIFTCPGELAARAQWNS